MNTRLKASLIAASIAALPFGADAAGLGRLNVMSGLGQPLRAEVELSASPQELQSLSARIPSPDAFRQANVAYSPTLGSLRLAVEQRGGRAVVKISSDKPVNAPFVDLLIELNWTGGQVQREYTFLLDPVDLQPPARAAVETAAPVARAPAPATPRAAARASEAETGRAPGGGESYQVQRGDTLRRIAAETRPEGVSLDQMMVALFRGNRSAFDADNINRLKAGKILSVPDAGQAKAISAADAHKEIAAHSVDFENYRRNLAGAVAAAPAQAPAPAGQESGGRITPKVAEPAAPPAGKDQVKISSLEAAKPGESNAPAARLQALEEDIVARDKALKEANARLSELEKKIQDLQKLVELKNPAMAQAQQSAQGGAAPSAAAPPPPAGEAAAPPAPAAEAPAPSPAPEAAAPRPAKPQSHPLPPRPPEEPGFLESLLSDPLTLAAGGGILALLLGYVGFKMRGRRQPEAPLTTQVPEFSEATSSVFGAKGGQSVDTGNSSLLQTDFSQAGLSSIDADEGVDPVAEADVYMAYGRDAQAEEILIDALKVDPSRGAVYVKLLEIYAHRKSLKQFESLATDFYSLTGGSGPDWEKAAAIGRKLDPNNPLYGELGGQPGGPPSGQANAAQAAAGGAALAAGAAAVQAATAPSAGNSPLQSPDTPPSANSMKDTWAMPGDLSQLSSSPDQAVDVDLTASLPILPPAQDLAPKASALDFDLDLGEPHSSPAAQGSPALDDAAGLDFHLDVGPDTEPADVAKPARAASGVDPAMVSTIVDSEDFRLDADELHPEAGLPAEPAPRDGAVDLSATVISPAGKLGGGEMDLEQTSFDPGLLDFDLDLDEGAKRSAPVPDLSGIDLNLDETILPPDSGAGEPAGGGEEVDTKLELARAYDEMGDREGAKELLEEVLKEGSTAQQAAARSLLARLG